MPHCVDFRTLLRFSITNISESGRYIGGKTYWKLFAIENLYRVIIHSVLSVQIPTNNWWLVAVNSNIRGRASNFKRKYHSRPWHTLPGQHYIYYVSLYDLNEIVRANSHLFIPVIADIDQWIVGVEMIRFPRNVVAHMNFLIQNDRARVDVLYNDFKKLAGYIQRESSVVLRVPR